VQGRRESPTYSENLDYNSSYNWCERNVQLSISIAIGLFVSLKYDISKNGKTIIICVTIC